MSRRIALIIPTRGRYKKVEELIAGFTLAFSMQLDIYIAIDYDDVDGYTDFIKKYKDSGLFQVIVNPRMRMIPALNWHAKYLAKMYDIVGFMGDDHRLRNVYTAMLIDNTIGEKGILYGDDGFQGANLPTAVFITSNIINALGYMVPETFTHLHADTVWKRWGEATNTLRYVQDLKIEHMHPHAGKAESDDIYDDVNSGAMYAADNKALEDYMRDGFQRDVDKINNAYI